MCVWCSPAARRLALHGVMCYWTVWLCLVYFPDWRMQYDFIFFIPSELYISQRNESVSHLTAVNLSFFSVMIHDFYMLLVHLLMPPAL